VFVQQIETLEAQHPEAPPGEMEQRRAAHPAQAEYDRIVRLSCHWS
jgi:hypothetical protein